MSSAAIQLGVSLGAWRQTDVVSKLQKVARFATATTVYPYPWNLPLPQTVQRDIREAGSDLGLTLLVHGPCWEVYTASVYPQVRTLGVDALQRAIDFAVAIGAVHITVHPGLTQWPDVWPHMVQQAHDAQAQSLLELSQYATGAGIRLGVENMPKSATALPGYVDFREVVRALQMAPELGVTLDVAHVHTAGLDQVEIVRKLGTRINHVHVTDNKGDEDSHAPVGEGTIVWDVVIRSLLEAGYRGVIELERSVADGGVRSSLEILKALLGGGGAKRG